MTTDALAGSSIRSPAITTVPIRTGMAPPCGGRANERRAAAGRYSATILTPDSSSAAATTVDDASSSIAAVRDAIRAKPAGTLTPTMIQPSPNTAPPHPDPAASLLFLHAGGP